jgi:hypothetical protein
MEFSFWCTHIIHSRVCISLLSAVLQLELSVCVCVCENTVFLRMVGQETKGAEFVTQYGK